MNNFLIDRGNSDPRCKNGDEQGIYVLPAMNVKSTKFYSKEVTGC